MKWVIQLYDKIYHLCIENATVFHFDHIGVIYERIMGYCIGQENLQNIVLNVSHDHKYKAIPY